jgi:hypothetical protein
MPRAWSRSIPYAVLATVAVAACGGGGPTQPSPAGGSPSTGPQVVDVSLRGDASFNSVGQTGRMAATARFSDQTELNVTELASWASSDAAVATVSARGLVTALAPGVARVSAAFGGRSAALDVTVSVVQNRPRTVRLLYLVPRDRPWNDVHRRAIQRAFVDLQAWYRQQMGGIVFSLYRSEPEDCALTREADFYATDTWNRVVADAQRCLPVGYGGGEYTWVLYADVVHACNAPGRIGAGTTGLTILGRMDLQGLAGEANVQGDCGTEPPYPVGRYVGGAGHELGHAFGLPHPPGCDQGLASCDSGALMWSGYSSYPRTYLRDDEKARLASSPYFGVRGLPHPESPELSPCPLPG